MSLVFEQPYVPSSFPHRWVDLFVPKFSISATYDLGDILLKMGIQDAFADNADFSGLTKDNGLKVSNVS